MALTGVYSLTFGPDLNYISTDLSSTTTGVQYWFYYPNLAYPGSADEQPGYTTTQFKLFQNFWACNGTAASPNVNASLDTSKLTRHLTTYERAVDIGGGAIDHGRYHSGIPKIGSVSTDYYGGMTYFLPCYADFGLGSHAPLYMNARHRYGIRMISTGAAYLPELSRGWYNYQAGVDRGNPPEDFVDQMAFKCPHRPVGATPDLGKIIMIRRIYQGQRLIPSRRSCYGTRTNALADFHEPDDRNYDPSDYIEAGLYDIWHWHMRIQDVNAEPKSRGIYDYTHELYFPAGYAQRLSPAQNLTSWLTEFWHGGNAGSGYSEFKGLARFYLGGVKFYSTEAGWYDAMANDWFIAGGAAGGDPTVGWGIAYRNITDPTTGNTFRTIHLGHTDVDEFYHHTGGTSRPTWSSDTTLDSNISFTEPVIPDSFTTYGSRPVKNIRRSLRQRKMFKN